MQKTEHSFKITKEYPCEKAYAIKKQMENDAPIIRILRKIGVVK